MAKQGSLLESEKYTFSLFPPHRFATMNSLVSQFGSKTKGFAMSRLSRSVVLGLVLLGVAASSVEALQIYFIHKTSGSVYTIRVSDGTNHVEILSNADVEAAYPVELLNAGGFPMKYLTIDESQQKLYWTQTVTLPTATSSKVVRCNLDGSNIEILPGVPVGDNILLSYLNVYNPPAGSVPAVSTWGFAVMGLLMLGIATLAFRRRV